MSKTLVAYFSVQGTTKRVAKQLAEHLGADLFEIIPLHPYTDADIRYTNPLARCNKEKFGKKEVPVSGKVKNFEEYDTVFIGFPIWYGDMPKFVKDYLVKCKLGERIVVPFATSGANGIDKAVKTLRTIAPQARIRRPFISSKKEKGDLVRWLEGLDVQMTKV